MVSGENSSRATSGKWQALFVPLMAAVVTVSGMVVIATPRRDIGWFAYAPLADQPREGFWSVRPSSSRPA